MILNLTKKRLLIQYTLSFFLLMIFILLQFNNILFIVDLNSVMLTFESQLSSPVSREFNDRSLIVPNRPDAVKER